MTMETAAAKPSRTVEFAIGGRAVVLGAVVLCGVLWLLGTVWPDLVKYPDGLVIPLSSAVTSIMLWVKVHFTTVTRGIAAVIDLPLRFAFSLLSKGFKIGNAANATLLPRLSSMGVTLVMGMLGYLYGGVRLALPYGLSFLALALFGLWEDVMLTLAQIIICVPICVVSGLLLDILAYRVPFVNRWVIAPLLDVMQPVPTFAYLIPMLLLFGASPVSALLATGLFATPPMVRATVPGLTKVPSEIADVAVMAGCTRRQKLWRVMVPSAKASLMMASIRRSCWR